MQKRSAAILAVGLLCCASLVVPVLSAADESLVEGPVLSLAEGPVLSLVEGLVRGTSAINRWVISAGGGSADRAGGVAMNGTLGQPIIGPASGGSVSLRAGYWHGGAGVHPFPPGSEIYLPLLVRDD